MLIVPLAGEARSDDAWLLRDRQTKLHLVAAGFLDDEVDRASMRTAAKALLALREAYQLTPEQGAIQKADLEKLAKNAVDEFYDRAILEKPLASAEVEILRRAYKDFGEQFELKETRSVHGVTFLHPKSLQTAKPPSDPYQEYEHPGPREERKRYEARVIVDNIDVISTPSNGPTVLSRFQKLLNRDRNESTEALSLSSNRYVGRIVYNKQKEEDSQRAYLRGYVAGDRFIGIHLWTNVYPKGGFVPLESHKRHAELIVKGNLFKDWLTPGQCEEYKISCEGKGSQGAPIAIQEPDRIVLVNAVAWRLMSGSIASYIFSHFDGANGWIRLEAGDCVSPASSQAAFPVRIIAASDRKFQGGRWKDPAVKVNDMFGSEREKFRLYCLLVEVPKEKDKTLPNQEPEGFRVLRDREASIGQEIPLGHDRFSLTESPKKRPGDRALIYVHGFDNTMAQAISRTANLAKAFPKYWGRHYLYSWPSASSLFHYVDDMDRSEQAEIHLRNFIRMVARDPNVDRIDFVAHSMGASLLLRALSGFSVEVNTTHDKAIGQIILAAPDIDGRVFDSRMALIAPHAGRITLYSTKWDLALITRTSAFFSNDRIGRTETLSTPYKNIHLVVVTDVLPPWYKDVVNHDYFAVNPHVLADIALVLKAGQDYDSWERQEKSITEGRKGQQTGSVNDPERPKVWRLGSGS
jgi:esterase/lipase superfamily enzyme